MNPIPSKDWTVAQTLQAYPPLASVFLHQKMACVGCRLARFCTLEEVACSYQLDLEAFLTDLQLVAGQAASLSNNDHIPA